jgi:pseudouridine-5'-phosphate glycosidase
VCPLPCVVFFWVFFQFSSSDEMLASLLRFCFQRALKICVNHPKRFAALGLVLICTAVPPRRSDPDSEKSEESNRNKRIEFLAHELGIILGNANINIDKKSCEDRGKPANSYHISSQHPSIIVTPNTTSEVSSVMALCNRYGIPVVPYGGGTSVEGQTLAPQGGLSLDISSMTRYLPPTSLRFSVFSPS